jgi:hypothetical protein
MVGLSPNTQQGTNRKIQVNTRVHTSVIRLFDFSNNQWFQFLKFFTEKELSVSIFGENQTQRITSSSYFRNIKEPAVFIKNQQRIKVKCWFF